MADEKLPSGGPHRRRRHTRNEWVAADRAEKLRTVTAALVVLVVLGFGLWLVLSGIIG